MKISSRRRAGAVMVGAALAAGFASAPAVGADVGVTVDVPLVTTVSVPTGVTLVPGVESDPFGVVVTSNNELGYDLLTSATEVGGIDLSLPSVTPLLLTVLPPTRAAHSTWAPRRNRSGRTPVAPQLRMGIHGWSP